MRVKVVVRVDKEHIFHYIKVKGDAIKVYLVKWQIEGCRLVDTRYLLAAIELPNVSTDDGTSVLLDM